MPESAEQLWRRVVHRGSQEAPFPQLSATKHLTPRLACNLPFVYDDLRRLANQHGVFRRKEALAHGYDDRALARAVRVGAVRRVRQGAYAFADAWDPLTAEQRHLVRARAVLRTARVEVALSHVSAAVVHGAPLWDVRLDEVHVTRTDGQIGRRQAGVRQHGGRLSEGHLIEYDGLPVTSGTRTGIDVATLLDVRHALPVLDHLLRVGSTTKEQLREEVARRRFWPDTLSTGLTVALADGRAESLGESLANHTFFLAGLPKAQMQYEIRDRDGKVIARVDFAWPELGVFVEFDGRVKYEALLREGESATDVVLREKRREEAICELTGWVCVRITWSDLFAPEAAIARIRRAMLRQAG